MWDSVERVSHNCCVKGNSYEGWGREYTSDIYIYLCYAYSLCRTGMGCMVWHVWVVLDMAISLMASPHAI
jgi:hypothetical protein